MKALTVIRPGHAEFQEVEKPKAEDNMILIRVVRAGICATDYSIYSGESSFVRDGLIRYPVRFGHEWSGVVEAVGENVKKFRKGDRVYADNGVSCGKCPACRSGNFAECPHIRSVGTVNAWDGCFAEYMLMPEYHVYPIPDEVGFEEAALIEPASIAYDALKGLSLHRDTTLAVIGVGAIGMTAVWLAKYLGAGTVIAVGRKDHKLCRAKQVGADTVINNCKTDAVSAIREMTNGRGADVIIETSGSEAALRQAFSMARNRGTIAIASFYEKDLDGIPMDSIVLRSLTIRGAAGCFGNPQAVCEIMKKNPVSILPVISHRVPFAECLDFFEHAEKYKNDKIKVMITFDEEEERKKWNS